MQLKIVHASAFVRVCASACIHVRLRAWVYAQKIKRPDVSRRKKSLCSDASFVQGLSGCTICGLA